MKKLLLTLAGAALALSASATIYTIPSVGTTDWTLDETAKTLTGTIKASDNTEFNVVIGQGTSTTGISGSLSNDLIKWYKNYTLKITAPEGVNMKSIVITASSQSYSYTFSTNEATGGTVTKDGTTITWINNAGVNMFDATASAGQIRIKSMVISDEETQVPVIETVTTVKATSMTASSARYAFYFENGYAQLIETSSNFGYPFLKPGTVKDDELEVEEANLFTFTSTEKGYTITDSKNRFMGMDATHFGSFNLYTDADAEGSNCYWDVTFEGENAKITNKGREGAYISDKKYNNDWEMVTTDKADQPLPTLFILKTDGVNAVAVEATDAPVEYFNLQGVRVAEPATGLYIRRQGNVVTKVLVK